MRPRTLVTAASALLALIALHLPAAGAAGANLLTGRIAGPDGSPAAGAVVRVHTLDPSPAAGPYEDPNLGTVVAGPDGRFALPLVLTSQLRDLAAFHGGALNLWVHAERAGALPAADLAYARLEGSILDAPAPLQITLSNLPSDAQVPMSHHGCMNYRPVFTVVERSEPLEPIGELHTGRDMAATFTYGERADTDLGGAYQVSGADWSVGEGSSHMGNTESSVTANAGPQFGKVQLSQFRYRKDRIEWFEHGLSGHPCRTDYRVVPEAWKGISLVDGADVSHLDGEQRFKQRADEGMFSPGKEWDKEKGRTERYTRDAQAFGIGLHSQSSWGNWVHVHYAFGQEPGLHYLFSTDKRAKIEFASTIYGR